MRCANSKGRVGPSVSVVVSKNPSFRPAPCSKKVEPCFAAAQLNNVHSTTTETGIASQLQAVDPKFNDLRAEIRKLSALIPADQYYRYNQMWNMTLQQAVFLSAYTVYLQHERLVSIAEVEQMLGTRVCLRGDLPEFHIGIEDYLHGLVSMTSELSRLAVNCVTAGDFARPLRISKFVGDLYSGFQLLNLKNDSLRKRFDAIKYDIKKIEEVVYDISVRGLATKAGETAAAK
ncbi:hypothetical protein HKX48_001912 [Thoreauomyces humboldtii]|nr:hypothetical protein HKX48_001912 [Thoreauomyces humboldtii]